MRPYRKTDRRRKYRDTFVLQIKGAVAAVSVEFPYRRSPKLNCEIATKNAKWNSIIRISKCHVYPKSIVVVIFILKRNRKNFNRLIFKLHPLMLNYIFQASLHFLLNNGGIRWLNNHTFAQSQSKIN